MLARARNKRSNAAAVELANTTVALCLPSEARKADYCNYMRLYRHRLQRLQCPSNSFIRALCTRIHILCVRHKGLCMSYKDLLDARCTHLVAGRSLVEIQISQSWISVNDVRASFRSLCSRHSVTRFQDANIALSVYYRPHGRYLSIIVYPRRYISQG